MELRQSSLIHCLRLLRFIVLQKLHIASTPSADNSKFESDVMRLLLHLLDVSVDGLTRVPAVVVHVVVVEVLLLESDWWRVERHKLIRGVVRGQRWRRDVCVLRHRRSVERRSLRRGLVVVLRRTDMVLAHVARACVSAIFDFRYFSRNALR